MLQIRKNILSSILIEELTIDFLVMTEGNLGLGGCESRNGDLEGKGILEDRLRIGKSINKGFGKYLKFEGKSESGVACHLTKRVWKTELCAPSLIDYCGRLGFLDCVGGTKFVHKVGNTSSVLEIKVLGYLRNHLRVLEDVGEVHLVTLLERVLF